MVLQSDNLLRRRKTNDRTCLLYTSSRKSIASSFDVLEPKGTRWHLYKYGAIAGNMLLMMFYTTISGWLAYYFLHMASGTFNGLSVQMCIRDREIRLLKQGRE